MSRRILIVQGHPDASAPHLCHTLADSYAEGAREADHEVRFARVAELDETNFGVDEAPMTYKGAMTRERGANLDLQTPRNPTGRPALHAAAARES